MAPGNEKSQTAVENYHVPVMLHEAVDAMNIMPEGVYADCTFGGGGHSMEILKRLGPQGKLIAMDQDADAKRNLPDDERVLFLPNNFRHISRFLRLHKIDKLDGALADLGVSSHQFDEAQRGFSIRFDAPMDMRMDTRTQTTAATILKTFSEKQLHKMFEQYGEVTNSKTLAKLIIDKREFADMDTINGFKQSLHEIVKGNPNKYFAQVFQALRIEVNDELGALKDWLEQMPALLKPRGRLVVITFHSLEDRIVKQFMKAGTLIEVEENAFGVKPKSPLKVITKKPVEASAEELKNNPRSRSAKLRIAEKI